MKIMKCPICLSSAALNNLPLYDDRYGYPGNFFLAKCSVCGHKHLKGEFTPEVLAELYTKFYPRSKYVLEQYQPHKEINAFKAWMNGSYSSAFRWIPQNVRILDIGCGFGESLGYHESRNCDVYGVEADENIRRVAEKFGYKVHVGLFDPNLYKPDFFDYITMDQVIEHVTNPIATLRDIARVLKPGGIAILTTPNSNGWGASVFGHRWINWHAPYHLQFFSVQSMQLASEQAGLIVEQVKILTSSEWLLYQWIHLILYPNMGEPSVFWSFKEERSFKEKLVFKLLAAIHKTKVNHLITRFCDSIGQGDNYVFFLKKRQ